MKYVALGGLALIGLLCGICAAAAPPDTLSLADLANRPDRWPAAVCVQHDFRFSNGAVVHVTDKLRILKFDGSTLVLSTPTNIRFAAKPEDCGLLEAANQAWAALTPAQRAVDPDSLAADMSLWPVKVTTTTAISCSFGKLQAGTEVNLDQVTAKGADIAWPNSTNRVALDFGSTDVVDRARQLVAVDPDKRPSRVAAALKGLLVDTDGKPYADDQLADKKIFAFYFGAAWCGYCHTFSPDFVKFLDEQTPKHPELAVVFLSDDKELPQSLAYMKQERMTFPAVPMDVWPQSFLLNSYSVHMIPHLVVVDRFGKVLATNDHDTGDRVDPKDTLGDFAKVLDAASSPK